MARKYDPLNNTKVHIAIRQTTKDIHAIEYLLTDLFYNLKSKEAIDDVRYKLIDIVNKISDDYIDLLR